MKSYLNTFLGQIANRSESELNLAKRAFEAGWMARAVAVQMPEIASELDPTVSEPVPDPEQSVTPVSEPVQTEQAASELTPLLTPDHPVSEQPVAPVQPVEPVVPIAPVQPVEPVVN